MAVNGILFLFFCSGSFFMSVWKKKKCEEILPLTCIGAMIVLYAAALAGKLKYGAVFLLVLMAAAYAAAFWKLWKGRGQEAAFYKYFFTPLFFTFFFLYVVLSYADWGKLADSWDEFSHWMDCVKAMTYLDDFVTSSASHSMFQSYPPGMALLQYFVQKIFGWMHPEAGFNEWRMYLAYQIFALSMFFPLLSEIKLNPLVKAVCMPAVFFLTPLLFFQGMYSEVWIDPFVAILAGCGFSLVLFHKTDSSLYAAHITGITATLILAKDAGLYFSVFLVIVYFMDSIGRSGGFSQFIHFRKKWLCVKCLPLAAVILAKLSWMHELKISNAVIRAGNKIDIAFYTRMFFLHSDLTYRQNVTDNFKDAFFNQYIPLAGTNIQISYFTGFIILAAGIFLLVQKTGEIGHSVEKRYRVVNYLLLIPMCGFYIYSLGAVYIANFSEREAVLLASYSRYLNAAYLAVWLVLITGFMNAVEKMEHYHIRSRYIAGLLACVLCIIPAGNIENFLSRDRVRVSIRIRAEYEPMKNLILSHCDGDDKIYFVSQESNGKDFHVAFYNARPNFVTTSRYGGWNMGGPFTESDPNAVQITADEWQKLLMNESFDYVAIQHVNDYFLEHYSGIFENEQEIQDLSLFRVNKKDGTLSRAG